MIPLSASETISLILIFFAAPITALITWRVAHLQGKNDPVTNMFLGSTLGFIACSLIMFGLSSMEANSLNQISQNDFMRLLKIISLIGVIDVLLYFVFKRYKASFSDIFLGGGMAFVLAASLYLLASVVIH